MKKLATKACVKLVAPSWFTPVPVIASITIGSG
jgi:hypothetical protein